MLDSHETARLDFGVAGYVGRPCGGAADRPSDAAKIRWHRPSRGRHRSSWRTGRVCLRPRKAFHVLRAGAVTRAPTLARSRQIDRDRVSEQHGRVPEASNAPSRAGPLAARYGHVRDRDHAQNREAEDRKSTRLNSSHVAISYAVFCLKKKNK